MADLKTMHIKLEYPLNYVKEPILYHLVKDYRLVPNLRLANIDVHTGGTMSLEIQGQKRISKPVWRSYDVWVSRLP